MRQVADHHIQAKYDDLEAAEQLSEASDVITYEFENVDLEVARQFEEADKLPQGAFSLEVTQNRAKEKAVALETGLPVAEYEIVETVDELKEALQHIGVPSVLKTLSGGYDGKGQLKFEYEEDVAKAKEFIKEGGRYIVEKWLDFDLEVSQVFTRGQDGDISYFPIGENVHRHQILHETRVPAGVSSQVEKRFRKQWPR